MKKILTHFIIILSFSHTQAQSAKGSIVGSWKLQHIETNWDPPADTVIATSDYTVIAKSDYLYNLSLKHSTWDENLRLIYLNFYEDNSLKFLLGNGTICYQTIYSIEDTQKILSMKYNSDTQLYHIIKLTDHKLIFKGPDGDVFKFKKK